MRIDERLARAIEKALDGGGEFLASKAAETQMNIFAMIIAAAWLAILTAWVFHQVRAMGAIWGL